jgi:hypothetical protein
MSSAATSIAISITGAAPFSGASDQTLSVAYISGLSLFYMVSDLLSRNFVFGLTLKA